MTLGEFYRNRRVLVTGLTGFKGLWLASWLERLGAAVTGFALPPTDDMRRGWPGMLDRFACILGDIRDDAVVQRVLHKTQPEIVFHLAAQPLVRRSYADPVTTFATNLLGTVHLLEAARQTASVRGVVVVTSDKCYENREQEAGYREDDPMGGHDPYSASKGCAELAVAAYRRSYARPDWRVASARAGNVIGGGDWAADRIVPDFVRSILAGQPCVLRRPNSIRPWQHVLEPLSGYLLLGERLVNGDDSFASPWNFGPPAADAVTVRELAQLIIAHWQQGAIVEQTEPRGPYESQLLRLDSTKAHERLGWRPLLTTTERVAWTVDWYQTWERQPAEVWSIVQEQLTGFEMRMPKAPSVPLLGTSVVEKHRAA
jgi:CDP-glucose 4,6-dehydratase